MIRTVSSSVTSGSIGDFSSVVLMRCESAGLVVCLRRPPPFRLSRPPPRRRPFDVVREVRPPPVRGVFFCVLPAFLFGPPVPVRTCALPLFLLGPLVPVFVRTVPPVLVRVCVRARPRGPRRRCGLFVGSFI